ncbi:hypothetical protein [Chryseobacterium culicis]|uniref:hypothetical protein n=1 Tax=Chryseobacterium culicis TaxID=680127 RepID=UPI0028A1DC59|nr:hypothetical protein [Chryseobacterium culicis]
MEKQHNTEYQALAIVADMVQKFAQLHILNIAPSDRVKLQVARKELEEVIAKNVYRMNYDKNIINKIIKL